jgi:NAD(P)-dependent dehydrogenase (short-subunit alcohol dehydrogenase family)
VLEDGDVEDAVAETVSRFGRLDAAVFSGGRQGDILKAFDVPAGPPASRDSFSFDAEYKREPFDIPFEAWHTNYEMNVLGPMRLFRAALPHFKAGRGGAFVAISGIEALQPRLPYPLGPNRLALHGFVKLLSDRYGRDGIRLNCVAPGLMENAATEFPEGWKDMVPAGRYGAVEEIAATVAFLLSEGAGYITGQTIVADGGVNRNPGM